MLRKESVATLVPVTLGDRMGGQVPRCMVCFAVSGATEVRNPIFWYTALFLKH